MAEVYATIANDGVRVQPTLVEGTTSAAGKYTPAAAAPQERVIQPKTAQELRQILEQVPAIDEEGNQPWGIIPGYAIAAKTGTSQESNGTCALCVYGSSYIGMAPGNDPQLVIAVNVQNPRKGGYFGDVVAGPVFYQVAKARAGHAADPAGRCQSGQDPPERAVTGGTLTPWRSDLPASSPGRCPFSARCSASGWPPWEVPFHRTISASSAASPSTRARWRPATCTSPCPAAGCTAPRSAPTRWPRAPSRS